MPIIGNPVTQSAFIADTFNGGQTVYSMSVAPANTASVIVAVHGLVQDPSTYAVNGNTLTFTAAPPSGTGNVSARYLGVPASGVVTTAYRTVTDFTAISGQTIFTPPSYTAGFIDVYRNGIKLGAADYTATNGTTITLSTASVAGDLVEIVSFYVSSVLNAIPAQAGAVGSTYLAPSLTLTGTTTASTITSAPATNLALQAAGATAITVTPAGLVGVGISPSVPLDLYAGQTTTYSTSTSASALLRIFNSATGATNLPAMIAYQTRDNDQTGSLWNVGAIAGSGSNLSSFAFQYQTGSSTFAEAVRIDSNGNFLIGATSYSGSTTLKNSFIQGNSGGLPFIMTGGSVQSPTASTNYAVYTFGTYQSTAFMLMLSYENNGGDGADQSAIYVDSGTSSYGGGFSVTKLSGGTIFSVSRSTSSLVVQITSGGGAGTFLQWQLFLLQSSGA